MEPTLKLLTIKEAAFEMGYTTDYFRRRFVNSKPPLLETYCPGPGCRKRVKEADVLALMLKLNEAS